MTIYHFEIFLNQGKFNPEPQTMDLNKLKLLKQLEELGEVTFVINLKTQEMLLHITFQSLI